MDDGGWDYMEESWIVKAMYRYVYRNIFRVTGAFTSFAYSVQLV